MTLAKAITKTLDVDVEDVRIDLTATIKSYDLTDTKFIFDIQSSNGLTINLTGSTATYIVEYVHNSQTYAIQGDITVVNSTKISFNLPEDLKGYKGTVLIGIYVKLTDDTKIDIKDIAVRIEPSIMDKDIDFSAKTYFKDFESVKAEVVLEGKKAKTGIDAVVADVQSEGEKAKTEIKATLPTLKAQINQLSESITDISDILDIHESVNLFDKSSTENEQGYYNPTTGVITYNSRFLTTHYIECKFGDTFIFVRPPQNKFGIGYNQIAIYDSSKSYVGYEVGEDYEETYHANLLKVTITNQNAKFIRIRETYDTLDLLMVVKSEHYPQAYTPYAPYFTLKNCKADLNDNPLKGKKLSVNGDSIMYGHGYTGGFAKIVAERSGMTLQNIAVTGATITHGTKNDGGTERHCISQTLDDMDTDADYYIFNGSVNDYSLGVEFGSVSNGFNSDLNIDTFCGAFESLWKQASVKFMGKKVGFVFVHRIEDYPSNYDNNYRPAMLTILQKWGVPYLDLHAEIPSLRRIPQLQSAYTVGDGWHPNEEGYKKYYCDKFEAWLKTL